ncbi:MAG: HD-GYP domain-containing protein [Sulfurimonas sp.]|uniref:HD-GYP domain-containing protein n=1 Tax=Sulfurimonas sp. TaxID=2022749 RepID=UPI003D0FFE67
MVQNDFIKHLQKNKDSNDNPFLKAQNLYRHSAEQMKKILSNIASKQDLDFMKESAKYMVDFVTKDCCTIESLTKILEHDYHTHTHSINVGFYAVFFGSALKLTKNELLDLSVSALLHDLGKSKIDTNIINKKGKLSESEFAQMKEHSTFGYELAKKYGITNKKILMGIRHHHERLDGLGYPDNLLSDEIKLFPKSIAICDVFDALTTKRSYKEAISSFEAFKLMKSDKYHLDRKLLNIFIQLMAKNENKAD